MSPEKLPASTKQEATVEQGDMLWNVLKKVGVNPTLQTAVTWKRGNSEDIFPLNSDEWRNLPIGAKVKVENGKITVENPGEFSEADKKKKAYVPVTPNISQEQYQEEQEEHDEANNFVEDAFENKEREEQDEKILDEIFTGEIQESFNSSQRSLREEGFSEENIAIWKEFCFSENTREVFVGRSARSVRLVKNEEYHVALQELFMDIIDDNPLEKGKNMSSEEFRKLLTSTINKIIKFIDTQESLYEALEANKTKGEAAKEREKQKNAEILIDELLPIPHGKELFWNKQLEEGNIMDLSMDYMDYRRDKLDSHGVGSDQSRGAIKYIEELRSESRERSLTLNYFLGEIAREKSPTLYKIYLIDGRLI